MMTTSVSQNRDPDSFLQCSVNMNCKRCSEWEHNLQKHDTNLLIMHGVQGCSSKAYRELKYIQPVVTLSFVLFTRRTSTNRRTLRTVLSYIENQRGWSDNRSAAAVKKQFSICLNQKLQLKQRLISAPWRQSCKFS